MKFLRFRSGAGTGFGILEPGGSVRVCEGDMFGAHRATGETRALERIELLTPTEASKYVALWNNSKVQIERRKRQTPREVLWFLKPPSSYLAGGQPIRYPVGETEKVVLEGELGIIIGKTCRGVSVEQARDCIFGYTVINDVTAQDIVMRDESYPQYTRAKAFDTFGIFGPVVETEVDPLTLTIRSFINGRQCQEFPATDLVFTPWETVAELARTMTLLPGDVIACGTSLGVEAIRPGDTVEIRIDGIGALVNRVV